MLKPQLVLILGPILGLGLAVSIMLISATVPGGAVPPFIYFQF